MLNHGNEVINLESACCQKAEVFKFVLSFHGEQSYQDYTVFFIVLKFCDIHKARFSGTPLETENVVIFAQLWWYYSKSNEFNYAIIYYIEVTLIDTWQHYSETSQQRTPLGLKKIVRYWEVSAIGR